MTEIMRQRRLEATAEGWGPAFSDEEFAQRKQRVIEQMTAAGIDTLLVTSPANITYLTGYDMVWYYLRTPTAVAIHASDQATLFFDLEYHRPTVEYLAVVDDVACYESFHGAPEVMVAELARRDWVTGRFALELWSRNPNGLVLDELKVGLATAGAEVIDGSWLVDNLRLTKSTAEIEVMRAAAEIADQAMAVVADAVRVGMTEIELAGVALHAMMSAGGGDPAIRVAVRSGPRFIARHCPPSHRRFAPGELVWVNFCGSLHRYHADLGRLLSLGEPDSRWPALIEQASSITDRALGTVKPGQSTQVLQDAADTAIDEAQLRGQAVLIGGYDMGIAIPPDWVGHSFTKSARGFRPANYDVGMTTNFEMLFRSGADWRGGAGGGFIDTVLMTDTGIEVLSARRRDIVVCQGG